MNRPGVKERLARLWLLGFADAIEHRTFLVKELHLQAANLRSCADLLHQNPSEDQEEKTMIAQGPDHDASTCPACQRLKWIKEAPRGKLEEALVMAEDEAAFHKGKRLDLEAERERLMRVMAAARKWLATGIVEGTDRFKASDLTDLVEAIASLDAGGKEKNG